MCIMRIKIHFTTRMYAYHSANFKLYVCILLLTKRSITNVNTVTAREEQKRPKKHIKPEATFILVTFYILTINLIFMLPLL